MEYFIGLHVLLPLKKMKVPEQNYKILTENLLVWRKWFKFAAHIARKPDMGMRAGMQT